MLSRHCEAVRRRRGYRKSREVADEVADGRTVSAAREELVQELAEALAEPLAAEGDLRAADRAADAGEDAAVGVELQHDDRQLVDRGGGGFDGRGRGRLRPVGRSPRLQYGGACGRPVDGLTTACRSLAAGLRAPEARPSRSGALWWQGTPAVLAADRLHAPSVPSWSPNPDAETPFWRKCVNAGRQGRCLAGSRDSTPLPSASIPRGGG